MASEDAVLGRIVDLMSRVEGSYPTWRIWEVNRQIVPAIKSHQAIVIHHDGAPVGFATWAWLSEADGLLYCQTGRPVQTPWNTGDQLWMIDFACLPGYFSLVQRWMAVNWYPGQTVHGLRHGRGHIVHPGEARARRRDRALQQEQCSEEYRDAGE
jgi:hemolysin-activating ACP:hemolysin acyltransferase